MTEQQQEKIINISQEMNVSFAQIIRCFNFWDLLTNEERKIYVEAYERGEIH